MDRRSRRRVKKPAQHDAGNAAGDRRRAAIVEAAQKLFLKQGYDAVSLDAVIAASHGSKATVYRYFGNKEGLFRAAMEDIMRAANAPNALVPELDTNAIEQVVEAFVAVAMSVLSEPSVTALRLAIAESKRFPDIAKIVLESGMGYGVAMLTQLLRQAHEAGLLVVPDPEISATLLSGTTAYEIQRLLLRQGGPPDRDHIRRLVTESARVAFLAYGPKPASGNARRL